VNLPSPFKVAGRRFFLFSFLCIFLIICNNYHCVSNPNCSDYRFVFPCPQLLKQSRVATATTASIGFIDHQSTIRSTAGLYTDHNQPPHVPTHLGRPHEPLCVVDDTVDWQRACASVPRSVSPSKTALRAQLGPPEVNPKRKRNSKDDRESRKHLYT